MSKNIAEAIENDPVMAGMEREIARLQTQNRDLLAALERIDNTLSTRRKGKAMEALSVARAAIAKGETK